MRKKITKGRVASQDSCRQGRERKMMKWNRFVGIKGGRQERHGGAAGHVTALKHTYIYINIYMCVYIYIDTYEKKTIELICKQ